LAEFTEEQIAAYRELQECLREGVTQVAHGALIKLTRVLRTPNAWSPGFDVLCERLHRAAYDPATAPPRLTLEVESPFE
jgi:hypothetical protein